MTIAHAGRAVAIVAVAGIALTAGQGEVALASAPGAIMAAAVQQEQEGPGEVLPFHSEVFWQLEQVPVPEGACTQPLPEEPPGLSYLWLSKISGMANTTHLGTGPYYIELCIYGTLTNPTADPPDNGIPVGWHVATQIWTAANGDLLKATGGLLGFTAPPGTPGFKFIESLTFLDGGTGRFEYAEGTGTGIVDPVAQTAVYDGWIRYGKRQD